MSVKRRNVLICLSVVCIGGLAWFALRPQEAEPIYNGKPLSFWLDSYRTERQWREADRAVRHAGTNAIPTLLRLLRAQDSGLKLRLVRLAQKQRMIVIPFVPASERKIAVPHAFAALGSQARDAVPELLDVYEHSPDAISRSVAAESLGAIGSDARQAIPALIRGATNMGNYSYIRNDSIMALGNMRTEHAVVVPALTQMLTNNWPDIQATAAMALGNFGPAAQQAVPALFELLKSPEVDPSTRKFAVSAIRKIDPATANNRKAELDAALSPPKGP